MNNIHTDPDFIRDFQNETGTERDYSFVMPEPTPFQQAQMDAEQAEHDRKLDLVMKVTFPNWK